MHFFTVYLVCFTTILFVNINTYAIDKIDIIAPSSRGKKSDLISIKNYVESLGFDARISNKIYGSGNPFYSNSDEFRANDLINALTNDSKIIWCIRGGEGAARLIPYLEKLSSDEKEKIAQGEKILIGYSDITALHIYLQTKYNWQTLHGTMLEMIVNNSVAESSIEKLKRLVLSQQSSVRFDNLKMINNNIKLKDDRLELLCCIALWIGGNA